MRKRAEEAVKKKIEEEERVKKRRQEEYEERERKYGSIEQFMQMNVEENDKMPQERERIL